MSSKKRKIRVTIVVSNIDKSVGFEWLVDRIDRDRFELTFILLNETPSYFAEYLKEVGITVNELEFKGKADIPFLVLKVTAAFLRNRPDVVHTHLFGANLIGQTAAIFSFIKKRVYTRHSSNENRRYYGKQWLDLYVNNLVTHIVAISTNVETVLEQEEGVRPDKIRLVHHGFDLDRFASVPNADIERLLSKYNAQRKRPVVGVIARYSHWKGIHYIIPAFASLLESHPNALLILANARRGDYKEQIAEQLSSLPEDSYVEIEFEHDLFALYRLFDVYVHTPIDAELEAFGQTYVEALAAGVPSVFTLSGVAPEFIRHEENALVVNFENSSEIVSAIRRLLGDTDLASRLSASGQFDVKQLFSIDDMVKKLEKLYAE